MASSTNFHAHTHLNKMGVAERKHRHIIETTRTLLATASVPYKYWPDAVATATYLINRLPSQTTNKVSPFELLHNRKPQYDHLKVFGSECFPLIPPQLRHKLQPKAHPHVFLGYSDIHKGYKCLNLHTNKITISHHVTFHEHRFPFGETPPSQSTNNQGILPPTLLTSISVHSTVPTRTSRQLIPTQQFTDCPPIMHNNTTSAITPNAQQCQIEQIRHPTPHHPMVTRSKTSNLKPATKLNLIHAHNQELIQPDPTNYADAVKKFEWRQAKANEFLALQHQGT